MLHLTRIFNKPSIPHCSSRIDPPSNAGRCSRRKTPAILGWKRIIPFLDPPDFSDRERFRDSTDSQRLKHEYQNRRNQQSRE